MSLELRSTAFAPKQLIPPRHTCEADDISVPLEWNGAPADTAAFALIMDDPDAPSGDFVHWVIYDVPADATGLPEGIPRQESLASGARQGTNDFGRIGFGGPCPPPGPAHRYVFKLYALDTKTGLHAGVTKEALLQAMSGHVLEEVQLVGQYQRREP